ncbi:hypothetical protein D9M68_122890 [compost metagenome]
MKPPSISNIIKDPQRGLTYNVLAYRTLTREEMLQAVQSFLLRNRGRALRKGKVITILSLFGAVGE